MKLLCRYGYSGSGYDSFTREEGKRSVEGVVRDHLLAVDAIDPAEWPAHASRTDKGVSAMGNAFCFSSLHGTDRAAETVGAFNSAAARDGVVVSQFTMVGDDFRARHAASRTYVYLLFPEDLPDTAGAGSHDMVRRLDGVVRIFEGMHDFTAFSKRDPKREVDPVSTIDECRALGPEELASRLGVNTVVFSLPLSAGIVVRSRAFRWNQVRRMVGAALECVHERLGVEEMSGALEEKGVTSSGRAPGSVTAPPQGLILWEVEYPDDVRFTTVAKNGETGRGWSAVVMEGIRKKQVGDAVLEGLVKGDGEGQ